MSDGRAITPTDRYRTVVIYNGDRIDVCETCGSLVGNALAHNEWHDNATPADATCSLCGGGKHKEPCR